jgi:hypothetical protein
LNWPLRNRPQKPDAIEKARASAGSPNWRPYSAAMHVREHGRCDVAVSYDLNRLMIACRIPSACSGTTSKQSRIVLI